MKPEAIAVPKFDKSEGTPHAASTTRGVFRRVRHFLNDDRGAVMVEYLVVSAVTLPLVYFLFHPDNGFYQAARDQFDLTVLLLRLPGP